MSFLNIFANESLIQPRIYQNIQKENNPRSNIRNRFFSRTRLFEKDPSNPTLKDHALSGHLKGYHAFSITGDIRVVYIIHNETAYFVDIGTHNQVY